jgi:hypothetical protein
LFDAEVLHLFHGKVGLAELSFMVAKGTVTRAFGSIGVASAAFGVFVQGHAAALA